LSAAAKNNPLGPSKCGGGTWDAFVWRSTVNSGRVGLAGGSLGGSEICIATYDYAETGDLDAAQQHLFGVAAVDLCAAGSIRITPSVRALAASRVRGAAPINESFPPRTSPPTPPVEPPPVPAELLRPPASPPLGGGGLRGCQPGAFAGESIAARSSAQDFTQAERAAINRIGETSGCHTCGTRTPGTQSGNFVPDHQPPTALNTNNAPQQLYPHCINCSREQGLAVARQTRGQ
jgi:hypothetical protein